MKQIAAAVVRWYQGEDVPPDNDPRSGVVFMVGNRRYHWTARVARRMVVFYLARWQWIWGSLIAVGIATHKK